ncbi:MAG TPA: DNA polymerase III subunit gamma/tau [Acidimicrobiales bacterium]|nr:DNA polymerase III subunit gamma/tau [Acidimicrobiales bacterium]
MTDEPFVSLYRRFRPSRFRELRGQPHVVLALKSAARDGHVAHAYLFSGPRGTGKTSTARILAKALNCGDPQDGEPCGSCASCVEIAKGTSLDVHELDAASNNGVDAMRDLIAHAALGTPGRWKVYIVDEVHMLSNAAANSLLKTLEEPPGHVVFVLATTDPQKVPPTIRSRTQHFEFRLLGTDTLTELVRDVNEAAGLSLDEDALTSAVRRGRGSARDTLSALDQVAATGSADDARPELAEVVEAIAEDDAGRVLVTLSALHEAGWGPQQLAVELADELRRIFLAAMAPELVAGEEGPERAEQLGLPRVVRCLEALGRAQVEMRDAPDPRVVLEVTLVRLARPELDDSSAALGDRLARVERALAGGAVGSPPAEPAVRPNVPGPSRRRRAPVEEAPAEQGPSPAHQAPVEQAPVEQAPGKQAPGKQAPEHHQPLERLGATAAAPDRDLLVQAWGDHVLRGLPARAKALFSAGRFVAVEDGQGVFALPNAAHRDKCEEVRPLVEDALAAHFGAPVSLRLEVEGATALAAVPSPGPAGRAGRDVVEEVEPEPADDIEPAVDMEPAAEARLLQAFPGAEEVPG